MEETGAEVTSVRRRPGRSLFGRNITLTGGPAPARAYIHTLMPGVLAGQVNSGRVFDRERTLDQVPEGYKEMDSRQALKVLIRP